MKYGNKRVAAVVALLALMTGYVAVGSGAAEAQTLKVAHGGVPAGLRRYQEDNILLNGDFQKLGINLDFPLYWENTPNGNDLPEHRTLHTLKDGTLEFKHPLPCVMQDVHYMPIMAWAFELSFKAEVKGGTLSLRVRKQRHGYHVDERIKHGEGFKEYTFPFKLNPDMNFGTIRVGFSPEANAAVRLRDVVLKPIPPTNKPDAKALFIEDAGTQLPLRGIVLAADHSFYDLNAARYLQKYLYVCFGRVVERFVCEGQGLPKGLAGMVCFGNSLVGEAEMKAVTAGGYALIARDSNIFVGGKDDGAEHGAFALLAGMGLEFFSPDDFIPASNNVIKLSTPNRISNPAFAVRSASRASRDYVALGYSDRRLLPDPSHIGQQFIRDHNNAVLVDPFIYFKDHPEYFPLRADGVRSWKRMQWRSWDVTAETVSGLRGRMHLCLSNPHVQQIAIDTVLQWFAAAPEMKSMVIVPGDGSRFDEWCQCKACKAFGVNATERYCRYVNTIARGIKDKYPDKWINAFAYTTMSDPPVNVVLEPNVKVGYAVCSAPNWGVNGGDSDNRLLNPDNIRGINQFMAWTKLGVPLGIYLYFPSFYEIVDKTRFFGAAGATEDIHFFADWNANNPLISYAMPKLAWDPLTPINKLVDRYLDYACGPGAPAMRAFFNLYEGRKQLLGLQDKPWIDNMGDPEFVSECERHLADAATLTTRAIGKRLITYYRFQLLTGYFIQTNSCLLRDDELERFAQRLTEHLTLATQIGLNSPSRHSRTFQQFIWRLSSIDIGDAQPWHTSPVVHKLLADPLAMITASRHDPYEKTATGLTFNLKAFGGGETAENYSYQGMPATTRPYARVLRRASSPASISRGAFELDEVPASGAILELEGLDDGQPGRATFKVLINSQPVFEGESTFGGKDWTRERLPVPAKLLKRGSNIIELINTTPDRTVAVANIYGGRNYFWGWLLIADLRLLFEVGANPVE
jgi:hypothetical protein